MSILDLGKADYQNLRAFLERVEVKGLDEVRALAVLAAKLEAHIATLDAPTSIPADYELNKE